MTGSVITTLAGKQFFQSVGSLLNATKCILLVWRPGGGVNFAVHSYQIVCDLDGAVPCGSCTGDPTDTPSDKGGLSSKLFGAADELNVHRWTALAVASVPTLAELPGRRTLLTIPVQAKAARQVIVDPPWAVPSGNGLWFCSPAINCGLTVSLQVELY